MKKPQKEPDGYDKQIDYLRKHPREIERHWYASRGLFEFAATRGNAIDCGCLTMVRDGSEKAETSELTEAIRADKRIPQSVDEITVESLPIFAEWQRKLDKKLGRAPFEWFGPSLV